MPRLLASVAIAVASLSPAAAQDFDPAAIDLARMIRCEMDARDYNTFAMWFATEPDAAAKLGWTATGGPNPLLGEFSLRESLEVFGHSARTVAFTSTGPLAVLPGVDPRNLAAALGAASVIDTPEKFLGEKVLVQQTEDVGGTTIETTVSLNVSTVDTHPGATLAGCSYRVEVK